MRQPRLRSYTGEKPVAQVKMGVSRLVFSRRDGMDVDVEQLLVGKRLEVGGREPGLLGDLAQRDLARIGLALAVPARLQPAVELAMVEQQHPRPRRVEDEAAAGQVPFGLRAQMSVGGMSAEEGADEGDVARFLLVGAGVGRKLRVERRPLHVHSHGRALCQSLWTERKAPCIPRPKGIAGL